MPELPEIKALSERLDERLRARLVSAASVIGFSALRTVSPAPNDLVATRLDAVTSRAKYLVFSFEAGRRALVHLGQAGRLDLESPPKSTRGRGAVLRIVLGEVAVFVREYGTERHAAWWVLGPGDDGPLATLGPEPDGEAAASLLLTGDDPRRLHTMLRDQHTLAGIGRGYADDILHRARLSPFASLASLEPSERSVLLESVRAILAEALATERTRAGGLSDARLGDRFTVHNRFGTPCPRCAATLARVSYATHEVTYCPACQTAGRVLADRRLSRLLR